VEAGIPWTCALPDGSLPEDIEYYVANSMGFDIIFSDSDNETGDPLTGARDAMAAWDSDYPNTVDDRTEDNAWMNTHVFGIISLIGDPLAPPAAPPADFYLRELGLDDEETDNSGIRIYPNPADQTIYLTGIERAREIAVINITGQIVCKLVNIDPVQSIDVSGLQSGVYKVRVLTCENELHTIPFVVR